MWTHIYDLLVKAIALALSFVLFEGILNIEADQWLMVTGVLLVSVLLYYAVLRTLGSYLYALISLQMPINWRQARSLNKALSPVLDMRWLPMKEVKAVKEPLRYEAALRLCSDWDLERRQKRGDQLAWFQKLDGLSQVVNVVLVLLFLAIMTVSILNVAPASYVTEAYCTFFNTEEYYPMLNMLILMLPLLGAAFLLSKLGIKFKK